ncbi:RNA polymerase sigma-E factor [Nonomuraea coxensis DSM 45129]|uniref:RNA polymerase sigma-E factor n=1 Tax=Nonomuraea coxensis DSM 45129 TaxID=1122611 RepID=A0ABX8TUR9_9ACTN|nr:SigE family RNA polymerase sigma factor [Nonomuraea coxensis]QYC38279.1 RNA polymerase sigma-E factor [Nonomuraea coxensis DSM 45129]
MHREIRNVMEDPPPPPPATETPAEAAAVAELFSEHRLGLVRFAFLLLGDQETAEDVVQDAFAAVHRRWSRLADRDRLLPYVRTAVLNGCRAVHRRRAVARRFGVEREAPFWSAETQALLGETRREVFAAVRGLSRRRREAVVLRYYLGLSEAETAEVMGVSRGTVKSTVSRALDALAGKLKEGR